MKNEQLVGLPQESFNAFRASTIWFREMCQREISTRTEMDNPDASSHAADYEETWNEVPRNKNALRSYILDHIYYKSKGWMNTKRSPVPIGLTSST
jgi:hypothetical protein